MQFVNELKLYKGEEIENLGYSNVDKVLIAIGKSWVVTMSPPGGPGRGNQVGHRRRDAGSWDKHGLEKKEDDDVPPYSSSNQKHN